MKRMAMRIGLLPRQGNVQNFTKQNMQTIGNTAENMNMNKIETGSPRHILQLSYQDTLDSLMRTINGFYLVIEALQERVRELEAQSDSNSIRKY